MPRLLSIQDRTGWAIPGFKAGSWTMRLDHELKEWDVHVRPTKVFLVRGQQVEELPRDGLRLSWAPLPGESAEQCIEGTQKWSSVTAEEKRPQQQGQPQKEKR
jgi:hypothetical protein